MKKILTSLLAVLSCCALFAACNGSGETSSPESESVTTSSEIGGSVDSSTTGDGGDETPTITYYTVTFRQDGESDVTVRVESGKGVAEADIPTLRAKFGHTATWETVDLTNVTQDIVVNAVYTPKTYKITLVWNLPSDVPETAVTKTEIEVKYNEAFVLPSYGGVSGDGWKIDYWKTAEGEKFFSGNYPLVSDITLYAEWSLWIGV
ncbi:MAG: hypothetical protein IJX96_02180 [Clostridia bacterium]|nr:hypothetical protein [Clostridia bacterium]